MLAGFRGTILFIHLGVTETEHVERFLVHPVKHVLETVFENAVIGVDEVDILACRMPQARIPRPGRSLVLLGQDNDIGILCGIVLCEGFAPVGTAVIHQDDLIFLVWNILAQ